MKREGKMDPEDEFAHNLAQLWTQVVKPVLDALAITVSDTCLVIPIFTTYYRLQEKQTFLVSGGVRQVLLLFSQSMLLACMERTMPLAQNCPILLFLPIRPRWLRSSKAFVPLLRSRS
jgi:hypothetical protein